MLFLAVFCGFLAENFREDRTDHHREIAYIHTLVEDIKLDLDDLNDCIKFRILQENRFDTLINLLNDVKDSTANIYYLARWATRVRDLFYHDRTIQQLKNSGGLRLIRNNKVSDGITIYDSRIRLITSYRQPLENESRQVLRNCFAKVFRGPVFNAMVSEDPNVFAIKPTGNPPLFSYDPALINEMQINVQYLKSIYRQTRNVDEGVVRYGDSLIQLIRDQYRIH
jgi:hypothetical protein